MSGARETLLFAVLLAHLGASFAFAAAPIVIETQPPTGGAIVRIDGTRRGSTTSAGKFIDSVEPGSHRIDLELGDGRVLSQSFTVSDSPLGTRAAFRIPPAPAPNAPAPSAARGYTPTATPDNGSDLGRVLTWVLLGILTVAVAIVSILVVHLLRQPAIGRVTTRRIDRYDVREVLGRGGMATVYRAVDSLNPRNGALALKVMDEGHLGDPDLVHKFLREGQMLQQFNEADPEAPLVRVFHWGQAGGTGVPFIAMELLEGQNLLQALKRQGKFSLPQAAHLVGGVARALIPAHAVGVYHRDLTPDNVILVNTPRGGYYLRLIDFGVARHEYTSHGTLDGSISGKPPYMSPEQCQGQAVDGRSDIYALGIMLYTLLAGSPPFAGRNPLEVMRMHKESAVPFPETVPTVARALLVQTLAKDPNGRPSDLGVFRRELAALERVQ